MEAGAGKRWRKLNSPNELLPHLQGHDQRQSSYTDSLSAIIEFHFMGSRRMVVVTIVGINHTTMEEPRLLGAEMVKPMRRIKTMCEGRPLAISKQCVCAEGRPRPLAHCQGATLASPHSSM